MAETLLVGNCLKRLGVYATALVRLEDEPVAEKVAVVDRSKEILEFVTAPLSEKTKQFHAVSHCPDAAPQ